MSNFSPHSPAPDEALHSFMDGELDSNNEQPLFDELAANPELRAEMKDLLAIRGAVHRDVLFPSAAVEQGIFAATGLAGAAASSAGAATAGASVAGSAAAGASSFAIAPFLYAAAGMIAGAVIMWSIITPVPPTQPPVIAGNALPAPQGPVQAAARVDTVFMAAPAEPRIERRIVYVQPIEAAKPIEAPVQAPVVVASESDPATDLVPETPTITSASLRQYAVESPQPMKAETFPTASISPMRSDRQVMFGFRTLASGLRASESTPQSVKDAVLPNTAFSLVMPLSSFHRVGVEMGSESFNQTFTGTDGNKSIEWQQTPVLFWMGATYQFTPWSWEILPGLSPFAQATLGAAFSQGPVGRGTIGLAYQPIGPVRLTLGLDGSALFYSYNNTMFTSTKLGLSYGLSVDLGAWK